VLLISQCSPVAPDAFLNRLHPGVVWHVAFGLKVPHSTSGEFVAAWQHPSDGPTVTGARGMHVASARTVTAPFFGRFGPNLIADTD